VLECGVVEARGLGTLELDHCGRRLENGTPGQRHALGGFGPSTDR
jgi:hypothetical protein